MSQSESPGISLEGAESLGVRSDVPCSTEEKTGTEKLSESFKVP